MPGGDGTGPAGKGQGTGRGMGVGRGAGAGRGRSMGRMSGSSLGPGGNCVCLSCGTKVAHQAGTPCNSMKCPKCGSTMVRE